MRVSDWEQMREREEPRALTQTEGANLVTLEICRQQMRKVGLMDEQIDEQTRNADLKQVPRKF